MADTVYNILVPVDFTRKTRSAIAKAIEVANKFKCNIHLVHVVSGPLPSFIPAEASDLENARRKLKMLKEENRQLLCAGASIEISLLHGNRNTQLYNYITQFNMHLVIIGLSKFNIIQRLLSVLYITNLAQKTNIPLLAIRASGAVSEFVKAIPLPWFNYAKTNMASLH